MQDLIAVYRELARAATTRCTSGSPRRAWAPRASSPRPRRWRCCCRKASATRSASRSRRSRAATARAKSIVAQELLQTMGLRSFAPMVIACPGCGRTTQHLLPGARGPDPELPARADAGVARALPRRGGDARRGDGLRGERAGRIEARRTSASACRARARSPVAPVYVDGEKTVTLKGERIAEEFQRIVEEYVRTTLRPPAEEPARDRDQDNARPSRRRPHIHDARRSRRSAG